MDEILKYIFYFMVFAALYAILGELYKFFTAFTKNSGEVKKAVAEGFKSGLQKGLKQNEFRDDEQTISETLDKVTLKIYDENHFTDSNILPELKKELNKFLWSKAVDSASEVLDRNQIDLIARFDNDFESFFNNSSISDNIKMDIFFKISKVRMHILQNDLIRYVKEKYDVSVESIIYENK